MSKPTALVSGASIAGPAAASWLAAAGWEVTVIERSSGLREEGQNVDVRGVGREVVRRMGLEDVVRGHHTTETGMTFVDADGRAFAAFPSLEGDLDSATAELEILRGDLSRLLYEQSTGSAEYLFGTTIESLHDDDRSVEVELSDGVRRRFDVVVIAEGSRSRTRAQVVPSARVDELGLLWAYFTIPGSASDDRTWRMHQGGRGRVAHLRPDDLGTARAMLSLRTGVRGLARLGTDDLVAVLRSTFGDMGWQTPRILDALDETSLYVDEIAQVRSPSWHHGRAVLLGDAAWNAGPFGTGTTSALAGAYVLAGELGTTPDDPIGAFGRYERVLRPMADNAQRFVPYNMHPRTPTELRLLRAQLRLMGSPAGRAIGRVTGANPSPPVDVITLPDYRGMAPLRAVAAASAA